MASANEALGKELGLTLVRAERPIGAVPKAGPYLCQERRSRELAMSTV